MIERDLELILDLQDVDGEIDIDGVLAALDRVNAAVTPEDLPLLLETLRLPRNNFWTRELLAEPVAEAGGIAAFPDLLDAFALNTEEGHDNDSFRVILLGMVEEKPEVFRPELERMLAEPGFQHRKLAEWLLSFLPENPA